MTVASLIEHHRCCSHGCNPNHCPLCRSIQVEREALPEIQFSDAPFYVSHDSTGNKRFTTTTSNNLILRRTA